MNKNTLNTAITRIDEDLIMEAMQPKRKISWHISKTAFVTVVAAELVVAAVGVYALTRNSKPDTQQPSYTGTTESTTALTADTTDTTFTTTVSNDLGIMTDNTYSTDSNVRKTTPTVSSTTTTTTTGASAAGSTVSSTTATTASPFANKPKYAYNTTLGEYYPVDLFEWHEESGSYYYIFHSDRTATPFSGEAVEITNRVPHSKLVSDALWDTYITIDPEQVQTIESEFWRTVTDKDMELLYQHLTVKVLPEAFGECMGRIIENNEYIEFIFYALNDMIGPRMQSSSGSNFLVSNNEYYHLATEAVEKNKDCMTPAIYECLERQFGRFIVPALVDNGLVEEWYKPNDKLLPLSVDEIVKYVNFFSDENVGKILESKEFTAQ